MTKQQLENNFNGLCAAMLNLYQRNPNSKIARRFIAACKTGEAELAVQILLNLWNEIPEDVREEVLNYHLDQQTMMYFTKDDKHLFRRELRLIRDKVNEGVFGEVKAGDNLTIGGRTVYTLLVGIEEMCPAYFLLRRRSLSDDLYYLPYLFVGENCRNNVLEWIISNTMSGKTTNDV